MYLEICVVIFLIISVFAYLTTLGYKGKERAVPATIAVLFGAMALVGAAFAI